MGLSSCVSHPSFVRMIFSIKRLVSVCLQRFLTDDPHMKSYMVLNHTMFLEVLVILTHDHEIRISLVLKAVFACL